MSRLRFWEGVDSGVFSYNDRTKMIVPISGYKCTLEQRFSNSLIERFSIECRETKTKAITMANHNKRKQDNEPMRTQNKYTWPTLSAGKRVWPSRDWFWFCIWLVEKVARVFFNQSQSVVKQNQSNSVITFDTQLKTALMHQVKTKEIITVSVVWIPGLN